MITLAVFVVVGELSEALACPMCKDAVDQSPGQEIAAGRNGLGSGFAFSIYMMLAVPYAIIGGFAYVVWRGIRRTQQANEQAVKGAPVTES